MSLDKREFERLLNLARVKLTGASDAAMKAELFDVLHEFFNDTSAWTEDITIDILPDTLDYTVEPSDGGAIIRLVGVVNELKLPQPAAMPTFGVVTFANPYNQAQEFTATVVKNVVLPTLKDQVPDAPDWVLRVFHMTVLNGLLGKMMASQNKPYSSSELGNFHLKKFRDGIALARQAKLRANTFGTQRWAFPQGYSTRSQKGGSSEGHF